MAMGVNNNTPDYIWRMEAGRNRLDVGTMERAGRYIMEIVGMDEERWPKMYWNEEVRNMENGCPSKWGGRC